MESKKYKVEPIGAFYQINGIRYYPEDTVKTYAEKMAKEALQQAYLQSNVRGQLIAFLREQVKLNYITIYENDFDFADKILKAINLP
jgi:hypothetical protein